MRILFVKIIIPVFLGIVGIISFNDVYNKERRYIFLNSEGIRTTGLITEIKKESAGPSGDSWKLHVKYLNNYQIVNSKAIDKLNVSVGDSVVVVYENDNPSNAILNYDLRTNFKLSYITTIVLSSLIFVGIINFIRYWKN